MIQLLELFGGIGAPRKALLNLGYEHKAIDYVEIDEKSVRTYNALYDHLHKPQSVVNWNLKPDILVHGSPCQDFSRAGTRLGGNDEDKTRSSLMWETIRIIKNMGEWKPKVVVWENVKGVLAKDMIHNFKKYFVEMEKLGYVSNYKVLDSRDFGVPQKRERVFVVSMLNGNTFDFDTLENKPMDNIETYLLDDVDEKYTIKSPSMLRAINKRNNFGGGLKPIEEYSWTITTKQNRCPNSGIIPIGNGQYRLLTELECWRLMGFDDEDYYKVANEHTTRKNTTNGTLYKQAGNSIVVQVLEAIFKQVIAQMDTRHKELSI
ncbi:DNA cytosine methyltransferase [Staphylococcus xylosus]|uniref:DNA cytosine methyltransferase n=1 Tax=Staphylococcus xylosus TaxID=1288 RepID=UPI00049B0039|nr:DNA cytosine methyltransferase [Staphylococcus xylosus]AID01532.1 DNA methyltransferase [Staphylococcus xylosus]